MDGKRMLPLGWRSSWAPMPMQGAGRGSRVELLPPPPPSPLTLLPDTRAAPVLFVGVSARQRLLLPSASMHACVRCVQIAELQHHPCRWQQRTPKSHQSSTSTCRSRSRQVVGLEPLKASDSATHRPHVLIVSIRPAFTGRDRGSSVGTERA